MDRSLLKGCKSSTDLMIAMIEYYELSGLPIKIGIQQLIINLVKEKYGAKTDLDVFDALILELLPEAKKFYVMKGWASLDKDSFLRAAELAMVDYAKILYGTDTVSIVAKKLHDQYRTPKRLHVSYSENNNNKAIRAMADNMLLLLKDSQIDISVLAKSYNKRKS